MTDKKLLEAAAKAAGIEIIDWFENDPTIWDGVEQCAWDPLTDDGDALRLMVKLHLVAYVCEGVVLVESEMDKPDAVERIGDDPYAATRRAIVRAAASIGGME